MKEKLHFAYNAFPSAGQSAEGKVRQAGSERQGRGWRSDMKGRQKLAGRWDKDVNTDINHADARIAARKNILVVLSALCI